MNFFRTAARAAVFAVAGLTLAAAPLAAQELAPEHLALARQYVDLTDRAAVYEVTLVETGVDTMRVLITQNPGLIEEIDGAIATALQSYRDRKGELLDQFARVYALRFTIEELREIVAFYESPVGVKLATANYEVNTDLQQVMQVFTTNLRREFLAQVRAELRSQGINL